ncbi:F0F1 ATP synthase subunit B [Microbacterium sp. NPDC064584]|uniref:F0F1 ATP synthase subunit B n=1 Tax=Microbacterium sp. NPDC064584 TaxID=3155817 RepID=UPI0034364EF5
MLVAFAEEGHAGEINPLLPTLPDLVWGTLAFLIILALFVWKILPNLNKLLDARAEAIEGSINSAEAAQAEAQAALEKYTAQLADARAEAGEIREKARADGSAIVAEMREQATAEAARITSNAHAQIEMERLAALASLRSDVGSLALDLAGGVIGETLSEDAKAQAVVDRFLAELEASEKAKS